MKPRGHLGQDRHAHLPASMRDHELDQFGRDLVGRRDEISLVLPVLIVNDNDDASFPERLEGVVDLREFLMHGRFLSTRKNTNRRRGACKLVLEALRAPLHYIQFAACWRVARRSGDGGAACQSSWTGSILHVGDRA